MTKAAAQQHVRPRTRSSPACETRFLGPTDHRGARVKATHKNSGKSVTLPWDHALGTAENHEAAALALFARCGWAAEAEAHGLLACSVNGGGYVFVVRV